MTSREGGGYFPPPLSGMGAKLPTRNATTTTSRSNVRTIAAAAGGDVSVPLLPVGVPVLSFTC